MIKTFADRETEVIFGRQRSRKFSGLEKQILRKLLLLHGADALTELTSPRGNWLEALKGDRAGQFSIRVNQQSRICFEWSGNNAYEVEVSDYH